MLETIWQEYLYRPLFNFLIYLYWNGFSLGTAVIYLTVILRVVLLPFSLISERNKAFYQRLTDKIKEIEKDYDEDRVKAKEVVRDLLKKNRVRPWAKVVVLGVQLLVLIILYQVFLGGINAQDKLASLYSFIAQPDFINTRFLWFDLSKRDLIMSALVGFVLFLEITFEQRPRKEFLTRREILYRLFLPLFVFLLLIILPSVKSLFILTSLLFSLIIIIAENTFGLAVHKLKK